MENQLTIKELRILEDILTTDWIIDKMENSTYWNPQLKQIGEIFNKLCITENTLITELKQ